MAEMEMEDESCMIGDDGVKVCKNKKTKKAPTGRQKISTRAILDIKVAAKKKKSQDIGEKKENQSHSNVRMMF